MARDRPPSLLAFVMVVALTLSVSALVVAWVVNRDTGKDQDLLGQPDLADGGQELAGGEQPTMAPRETGTRDSAGIFTCNGSGEARSFPISALEGPVLSRKELGDREYGAVLTEFFTQGTGAEEAELFNRASGFLVLTESDDVTVLGGLENNGLKSYFVLEQGDRWEVEGWGDCEPMVQEGDLKTARWSLVEDRGDSLEIAVLGGMCSGEEATKTRIVDTVVSETSTTVTVTVWVREEPPTRDTCAEVAFELPVTVRLDEAVGGRQLLDGAVVPPTPPIVTRARR